MATDESHELVAVPVDRSETSVEPAEFNIQLGQWYWVKDDDDPEWLGCVMHIGSNYVKFKNIWENGTRIHLDVFEAQCRLEPNASAVIAGHVLAQKDEVRRILSEIEQLTARLGVGRVSALGAGSTGQALATMASKQAVDGYKAALILAKEKELPELFKLMETAHSTLARWMKAETFPMKAQVGQMEGVIGRIDDRIFNVELYAGLTEWVTQIAEGAPAAMTEKIRLMQRLCYMDEECLAQYKVGGMEFNDITEFDDWIATPENRDRLLPFPRCIVSFRVRRNAKLREITSLVSLFDAIAKEKADKLTFLYIRNGDKLYRINTELEFGPRLFEDADHHHLKAGQKLWATVGSHNERIITDDQYQGLCEDFLARKAEHAKKKAQHEVKHKAWRKAKKAAKLAKQPFDEREPWFSSSFFSTHSLWDGDPKGSFHPFEPNNIYYDDIQKRIATEIQKSNRIGLIIQGLLDRSPVLHPHPPWKIWSEAGFDLALELIYDESRALVSGDPPDFEAYRQRLNASLKVGSVTVGQRACWLAATKDPYDDYDYTRKVRRHGDPGPDGLARVAAYKRRAKSCEFAWYREASGRNSEDKEIRTRFACETSKLLNVDAYTPGDFKIFYADPRTRAEYLQWAPLLLEAEEYHAGNRTVEEPPPPTKRRFSYASQLAYQKRQRRLRLVGKAVKLRSNVTMQSGKVYKKGTLWRVDHMDHGLHISEINKDGTLIEDGGSIRGMESHDLEEQFDIPPPPPKPEREPFKFGVPGEDDDDEDDDEDHDSDDGEPEDADELDESDDDEDDSDEDEAP